MPPSSSTQGRVHGGGTSLFTPARNRLASIIVHPPRMSVEPDTKGFKMVQSWRCWRHATESRRPMPVNLVGKCFNCLSDKHVKADCMSLVRCFNCLDNGHQACDCPLPLRAPGDGKHSHSPAHFSHHHGRARRHHSVPH